MAILLMYGSHDMRHRYSVGRQWSTGHPRIWGFTTSTLPEICNESVGHQPYWANRTSTLPELCNEPAGHQPYLADRTSTLPGLCNEKLRRGHG